MRPSWDEYFMEIAEVVKTRSTCIRRQVGAVIVKEKQILTTGYNGAPKGIGHCDTRGCPKAQMNIPSGQGHELCIALHAEQNAIVQASYHGISIKDSVMYVTTKPCILCAKMCINAGIRKIIYRGDYPDDLSTELLEEAGVELIQFK
ncbi:MAG: cytidine/deoxycytidylate deaminase family protein [Clostridioides difficile]|nr:cytidine/deoxycytidylate deaminase family protein [Clostridioides sp.]MBS5788368.1 cytidine/deoxycytidylate deaminase family protein [Clostridioides difficile]